MTVISKLSLALKGSLGGTLLDWSVDDAWPRAARPTGKFCSLMLIGTVFDALSCFATRDRIAGCAANYFEPVKDKAHPPPLE